MNGAQHFERAEDLAEHANLALVRDGDRDEAAVLTALAQVHADLAHVAVITGWGRRSRPVSPFAGRPFEGIPTT